MLVIEMPECQWEKMSQNFEDFKGDNSFVPAEI